MECKTSYEDIINNEKDWNQYLNNSVKMLKDIRKSNKKEDFEERFISLIFTMRTSHDEYEELKKIIGLQHINIYELQKHFKYYISNIDSALDIYQKFINKWGACKFERETYNKLNGKINYLRNIDLHQKIPSVKYQTTAGQQSMCPAYMAGTQELTYISISIFAGKKDEELKAFLDETYNGVKSIIETHISFVIDK